MKDLIDWIFIVSGEYYPLDKIEYITYLRLRDLKMKGLHPDISKLKKLEILDISFNLLQEAKIDLPFLKELYCSSNLLNEVILKTPKLQILNCNQNKLEKIFLKCPQLRALYCRDNNMVNLVLDFDNLNELSCYGNKFVITKDSPLLKSFEKFNFLEFKMIEHTIINDFL